jgi:hypothetical protein
MLWLSHSLVVASYWALPITGRCHGLPGGPSQAYTKNNKKKLFGDLF